MVAAVMAVVHMAACMAVPPPAFAFVPTAEDMKLSPRAFHRKMCSGQEVAGHAGFYVMVQYSVSQLCNELQKLESWSAADP